MIGTPDETVRRFLRLLVDNVWNDATHSTEVPATSHADQLIDATIYEFDMILESLAKSADNTSSKKKNV